MGENFKANKGAKQLLDDYAPTAALKYKFADKLHNNITKLLSTTPIAGAIGRGTELVNVANRRAAGDKSVDFSSVPEAISNMVVFDLFMKIPSTLPYAFEVIKSAKKQGYDKADPEQYNQYNKQAQDALNLLVSAKPEIYNEAMATLGNSKDPNMADAKLKISTFRDYFNALPAELSKESKDKALHILQLKTEAVSDAQDAPEGAIKSHYETKAKAYDGLLQKVIEGESVNPDKEPLLISRFAAPPPPKKQEDEETQKAEPPKYLSSQRKQVLQMKALIKLSNQQAQKQMKTLP